LLALPVRLLLLSLCALLLFSPQAASASLALPEHVTYVAIGDSVTAGWGSAPVNGSRLNGYVSQLHRQLLIRGTSDLHNLGIPGLTSGQFLFLLEHWPELRQTIKKADLITLSIGGNDIIWTDHQSPGDIDKMREALTKYEENVNRILAQLRQWNQEARLFVLEVYNPFPEDDGRHAPLNEWVIWVNKSLARAATLYDARVVPTASLFFKHETEYVNLSQDDIHPNAAGHTRIAEQISRSLFGRFVPLLVEAKRKPNLLFDGNPKTISFGLLYENGTVYISTGQLAQLFGSKAIHHLCTSIGAWWLRLNGKLVKLPSPVLFLGGDTYVPLRAVSETLGAKVYWVEDSLTLNIVMPKPSSETIYR
jgi:lysophospholipase L1-like esterase